ncbi:MAG: hypothetical protein LBR19_03490, partial [Bifidobacteriaceae bacterium]|nr:hypothetical protein [Bifidobacteriaceae bacterium]
SDIAGRNAAATEAKVRAALVATEATLEATRAHNAKLSRQLAGIQASTGYKVVRRLAKAKRRLPRPLRRLLGAGFRLVRRALRLVGGWRSLADHLAGGPPGSGPPRDNGASHEAMTW